MIPSPDLPTELARLGLKATAQTLDDFLARATQKRWSPLQQLEEIARAESEARAQRGLQARLRQARLGRFRPLADFDWNWPKKIDRDLIQRALTLDFIAEARNLILVGTNGVGKTLIAKNLAHQALLAGYTVWFRSAADLLTELAACESPHARRRKLKLLAHPHLLAIDEVGYLSYDSQAADLLYEIVNARYERRSLLITTNRSFKDWNTVFPNSTVISTLLDRLTHHADVTLIEGHSYRVRESELEAAARKKKRS
ncbi:MAG: AAA family ATPase [Acidimicrobiia bacterium]|nr:AAA family ATPase [Acidimicrobiia bacterium]